MIERNANGCLLGLACGDALGRPVEFRSAEAIATRHGEIREMRADGTHGQPAGTITDDTELALRIAESLVDRGGFDPDDIAERFVDWLDTDPFDVGLMTREALARLRAGASWDEAGVAVWHERPEGSNAGNGSVMRCAPHAIAFGAFEAELAHVSRQSSAITHADPRCQWGCVALNRTLAGLLRGDRDPLGTALECIHEAPDELRTALQHVQDVIVGERDAADVEPELATTGYVVDTLQASLFYGLTADSVEESVVRAVNRGGDTDTVGAIAGAVAGARFGADDVPDRWTEAIAESDRLEQLAERLLEIRSRVPGKEHATLDDGSLVFKGRTVDGPAVVPSRRRRSGRGHRPDPAPHRVIETGHREVTPQTAAMLDWERRAYAVDTGRTTTYVEPRIEGDADRRKAASALIPVPQYPFVDSIEELPARDRRRIERDASETVAAYVRAYAAFAGIRESITSGDAECIGIERIDPIVGATRVLVDPFRDLGETLTGQRGPGGYAAPEDVRSSFGAAVEDAVIVDTTEAVHEATELLDELNGGTAAVLDYVTQVRIGPDRETASSKAGERLDDLRAGAQRTPGELHVAAESLRRVVVRHPDIDREGWDARSGRSGGW